jgi:hypothetical protein
VIDYSKTKVEHYITVFERRNFRFKSKCNTIQYASEFCTSAANTFFMNKHFSITQRSNEINKKLKT